MINAKQNKVTIDRIVKNLSDGEIETIKIHDILPKTNKVPKILLVTSKTAIRNEGIEFN